MLSWYRITALDVSSISKENESGDDDDLSLIIGKLLMQAVVRKTQINV